MSRDVLHPGEPARPEWAGVVTLMKLNDNTWAIPPFTFLNDRQYEAYEAGDLYVNVRSLAHPNGEIRAQLTP
jgi:CHRD domain